MTASFGFRYYVLRFPVPTVKSTRRFNLLLALPTTICFVLFSFGRSPKSDIEDLLLKYVPQYDFSTTVIEALLNPTRNPCVLTTVWIGEICVALSPLTTLYFVKPYREKVVDLVMRRQRKLTTLSSTDFSSTDTGATRRQSVKAIKISIHSNHLPNQ
ncbi:hypothetical protein PRIPAC_92941 [Pristionchus pacificus]|uniref:G protein-coupled receptor n=1 Tax=Pristionchus pacificus TaxID=54126 RepID=A0A2A6CE47_PRIPA|nr:hypothetical protein PRIPAC_92941 [Pristionchus pacificus]|eukprot:PDM76474.1 G protein-coupled receptor [Pristionchus pacificus]